MTANDLWTKVERWLQVTQETADQVGGAAWSGAVKAGRTAENAVMYTRLRLHTAELSGQVRDRLQAVGELVYATHTGNPSDSGELQRLLGEIDALRRAIRENERTMASLRGVLVCPACGAVSPADHAYCEQCGQALQG